MRSSSSSLPSPGGEFLQPLSFHKYCIGLGMKRPILSHNHSCSMFKTLNTCSWTCNLFNLYFVYFFLPYPMPTHQLACKFMLSQLDQFWFEVSLYYLWLMHWQNTFCSFTTFCHHLFLSYRMFDPAGAQEGGGKTAGTVFFSFQFYRNQQVTTERLVLLFININYSVM